MVFWSKSNSSAAFTVENNSISSSSELYPMALNKTVTGNLRRRSILTVSTFFLPTAISNQEPRLGRSSA